MAQTNLIAIDSIVVGNRHRKDFGELEKLAESIKRFGVLQPVVVNSNNVLLAGQRRIEASKLAGLTHVPFVVVETDSHLTEQLIEESENEDRKGFTMSERLSIKADIEKLLAERKLEVPKGMRTDQFVAEKAGFDSTAQMRRAQSVIEHGTPELQKALDAGEISVSAAANLLELKPEEQIEVVKSGKAKEKASEIRKDKAEKKKQEEPKSPKKPKSEEKTKPVLLDEVGKPVPDRIADAFFDPALKNLTVEVEDHIRDLRTLESHIKGVAQKSSAWPMAKLGYSMKAVANAIDDVKEALALLQNGLPYAVCQKCNGSGCVVCGQMGYLTKHMFENADQYGG